MSNIIKSQIIISDEIKELVAGIESPATSDTLIEIRNRMYSRLETRPYNQSTREHEKTIRWKRTSAEIIKDGYVYTGKACTDQVILFMALCEAFHLTTRFVKLKKYNEVHSVAEIKLEDGWYIFDVSRKGSVPEKGEATKENTYHGWQLWQKGRDAWDLGLVDFDSIEKMY